MTSYARGCSGDNGPSQLSGYFGVRIDKSVSDRVKVAHKVAHACDWWISCAPLYLKLFIGALAPYSTFDQMTRVCVADDDAAELDCFGRSQ